MTVERSVLVAVPRTERTSGLVRDIISAARRATKADPGDRGDVIRYETLSVQLETLAAQEFASGTQHSLLPDPLPDDAGYCFDDTLITDDPARLSLRLPDALAATVAGWLTGATVVELRLPLEIGATALSTAGVSAPDAAQPWRVSGDVSGSRAVEQRFRFQLEAVIAGASSETKTRGDSIDPSGVNNRIITQTLYDFLEGTPDSKVEAPVTYRDGSEASNPFPLRCLPLSRSLPTVAPDLELHLALLSIRHTEMDPVVDGAWLRNAEVSRPRPAALTDDFVYETSRTQLTYLSEEGRLSLLLHIYQTGLDTAIMGFYRAVVDHLLDHPYSLSVVPMYFASESSSPGLVHKAPFRPGKPWTMGDRS